MSVSPGKHSEVASLSKLATFTPFENLTNHQLGLLQQQVEVIKYASKETILELRDNYPNDLFLLEGEIKLIAADGKESFIVSGTAKAKAPIARLRPSMYQVIAVDETYILSLAPNALSALDSNETADVGSGYEVLDDDDNSTASLTYTFNQALIRDECQLPSLPDLAIRIRKAVADEQSTMQDIANIVQMDPAITAKLIKVANSPVYRGVVPVDTVSKAITRIGTKATVQMVITFTMKELFRIESPMLKKRMQELWNHSCEVSAICFSLAQESKGIDPDEALLAGLVHDIGVIPILSMASDYPELMQAPEKLEAVIEKLSCEFSATMLRKWNFPDELILAAAESENWQRQGQTGIDIADLVIVAQLLSYSDKPRHEMLPPLAEVPAFKKVADDKISPDESLSLLEHAHEQIEQTKHLLMH